jgi:hypothetical protein
VDLNVPEDIKTSIQLLHLLAAIKGANSTPPDHFVRIMRGAFTPEECQDMNRLKAELTAEMKRSFVELCERSMVNAAFDGQNRAGPRLAAHQLEKLEAIRERVRDQLYWLKQTWAID